MIRIDLCSLIMTVCKSRQYKNIPMVKHKYLFHRVRRSKCNEHFWLYIGRVGQLNFSVQPNETNWNMFKCIYAMSYEALGDALLLFLIFLQSDNRAVYKNHISDQEHKIMQC